jgi:hypothetical protein
MASRYGGEVLVMEVDAVSGTTEGMEKLAKEPVIDAETCALMSLEIS